MIITFDINLYMSWLELVELSKEQVMWKYQLTH